MGFVAAEAVSEMDFDFTGLDARGKRIPGWPEELYDVKGVVPEPSQEQVRKMQVAVRDHYGLGADADAETVTARVAQSVEEREEKDKVLATIYADACSQTPTTEQLLALPNRHYAAFIGWISGEFFSPTAGTSATKLSLVPSKNAG